MTPPLAVAHDLQAAQNLVVGDLADRLSQSFRAGNGAPADARWALIEKVLTFAAQAEQQIAEQRRRIAQLESLSATDELTGLLNRRGFEDFLRRTLAAANRHGESGLMAYLDLDNFKAINDAHGHDAGDAVLRHVAAILSGRSRVSDAVARLHGDEFALLLVRADVGQGETRLRAMLKAINGSRMKYQGREIALSASCGIAPYGPKTTAAELMRRADRAMYERKRARTGAYAKAV